MNCFQLIKEVLDVDYAQIPGSDKDKDEAICKRLEELKSKYSDLTVKQVIDYSDPITRFAYVYRYVTSHANAVYKLIEGYGALRNVFATETVKLTCIGGGPGSDVLGVIKYLDGRDTDVRRLRAFVFDREPAWADNWGDVFTRDVVGDVQIVPAFQTFDVTDPRIWGNMNRYRDADLITMVYFMSEVFAIRPEAEPFFMDLFTNVNPGTMFLFVDNDHSDFYGWFDELAGNTGLEILKSSSGLLQVPFDEQKRDLEPYYSKFNLDPKLSAKVAWRLARRP